MNSSSLPVLTDFLRSKCTSQKKQEYLPIATFIARISTYEIEGMSIINLNRLAFDELRVGGLGRSAAEKFAGAWLACLLVMARGNIFDAFSVEHILLATVCGTCRSSAHVRQCPQLAKADRSAVGGAF